MRAFHQALWLCLKPSCRRDDPINPAAVLSNVLENRLQQAAALRVRVYQLVKSLQGDILSSSEVLHVFTLKNGLTAAMDLGSQADSAADPSAAFAHRS